MSSPFPESPVLPAALDGAKTIRFSCHRAVACWNACCSNIDISLTPVDIVRLKSRLGMTSTEFLHRYTVPYEMEKAGIGLQTWDQSTARSSLIMGWFPCAAAVLGSPNAQGKPAQHIHL